MYFLYIYFADIFLKKGLFFLEQEVIFFWNRVFLFQVHIFFTFVSIFYTHNTTIIQLLYAFYTYARFLELEQEVVLGNTREPPTAKSGGLPPLPHGRH